MSFSRFLSLLILLTAVLSNIGFSKTPLQAQKKAFHELYYDTGEDGRYDCLGGCQRNAVAFVLEDLIPKNIPFQQAYLVSLSTGYEIHYFQSNSSSGENVAVENGEYRYKKTRWSGGSPFFHTRWYYHSFLVIDGRVFDFSIRDGKVQRLPRYLRKGYLPPKGQYSERRALTPRFDEKTLIADLSGPDSKMRIHRLDSLSKKYYLNSDIHPPQYYVGEPAYQGRPIELFLLNDVVKLTELPKNQRKAATKRMKKLRSLIESDEFDNHRSLLTETRCIQILSSKR